VPGYWPDLLRVLAPGGLLVVDNAISHAVEVEPFAELVRADRRFVHTLDATGAGVLLTVKDRSGDWWPDLHRSIAASGDG
jgi:predicted O-methyltransferase YrrM